MTTRLGLIGDNIAASQSPRLHELAGRLTGIEVSYERLIPRERGRSFEEVFEEARAAGYRGLNVTYPYKERVTALVRIPDPRVAALGACNTALFTPEGPEGHNTDWSGFMAAYRHVLGEAAPGAVCMVGAGGVGKAVAFGLMALGATELRILERDRAKAEALAEALKAAGGAMRASVAETPEEGVAGAAGLINCTPVGMVGYEGTPLPASLLKGAVWAFDAVYTPVETQFLREAEQAGLKIVSGYELYFYQGLHAYELFHGRPIPEALLREALKTL
ncbi:shikimate dehydrogenase family protein [Neomegalonema perideroedes]|uniref:shikimate dehydrogenase family protein n=1 Tax=Neomegalonema perideroedes TaxID=217219 RepID=UPI00036E88AC|nr:shikimate dehydrogenase [Neomegalonema perideroedes]